MPDDVAWLAALSPWPEDGFGLERMLALLAALEEPQLRYPAVHVVGTNGKSTATVTVEQLLLGDIDRHMPKVGRLRSRQELLVPLRSEKHGDHREIGGEETDYNLFAFRDEDSPVPMFLRPPESQVR